MKTIAKALYDFHFPRDNSILYRRLLRLEFHFFSSHMQVIWNERYFGIFEILFVFKKHNFEVNGVSEIGF